MSLYVYYIGIIDDWYGWRDFAEAARGEDLSNASEDELYSRLILAGAIARKSLFWEGDVRTGPYWTPIPIPDEPGLCCEFMIAWKQHNNGQTYVASPFPLPWLKHCDCAHTSQLDPETRARVEKEISRDRCDRIEARINALCHSLSTRELAELLCWKLDGDIHDRREFAEAFVGVGVHDSESLMYLADIVRVVEKKRGR